MNNHIHIIGLPLQKMHNDAHRLFMSRVNDMFEEIKLSSPMLEAVVNVHKVALDAETKAAGVERKSVYTDEMRALNQKREEVYAGLYYHVESCLRHYNEGLRPDAERLKSVLKPIARIHNSSTLLRGITLGRICRILREDYASEAASLELEGWIGSLEKMNEQYDAIALRKTEKKAEDGNGNVGLTRITTDQAYRNLMQSMNGLVLMEGYEAHAATLAQLNTAIKAVRKSIAIREGMRKSRKARLIAAEAAQAKQTEKAENPAE